MNSNLLRACLIMAFRDSCVSATHTCPNCWTESGAGQESHRYRLPGDRRCQ